MRAPLLLVGAGALLFFVSRANAARRANEEWDSFAEELSYTANPETESEPVADMPPAPPTFDQVLRVMLPPIGGRVPHLTGTFDEMRGVVQHRAVDFNYRGGQTGINMQFPAVHSPIAGEVTFSGGQYGTVKIQDENGFSHEFLHLNERAVNRGQFVHPGDVIGTMGGRGPNGPLQYARHVHYQLKTESGDLIDPVLWWESGAA